MFEVTEEGVPEMIPVDRARLRPGGRFVDALNLRVSFLASELMDGRIGVIAVPANKSVDMGA